ncbi:hypothetical protein K491DRAFT_758800 [Lophiostoma macrostomum CBS 122681]|uniref:Uncharacterized protein n=1 Tax=Lophiostoma macrostomum CBS 122681 TaxID=1314788 RepID=A0A6A6T6Y7_9PLEO|nr:hypothetical protein K491DRAFT_758800 [Lophiostoma macrostomum CBS 122681]
MSPSTERQDLGEKLDIEDLTYEEIRNAFREVHEEYEDHFDAHYKWKDRFRNALEQLQYEQERNHELEHRVIALEAATVMSGNHVAGDGGQELPHSGNTTEVSQGKKKPSKKKNWRKKKKRAVSNTGELTPTLETVADSSKSTSLGADKMTQNSVMERYMMQNS